MKYVRGPAVLLSAALLALTLWACGDRDLPAGSVPPESSRPPESSSPSENTPAVTMEVKLCTVNGQSVRGVGLSEPYREAYDFAFTPEQVTGGETLLPGMIVEIGFDGTVLETWPAQIHVDSVTVKERQTDYFTLYYQILEDILREDEGLNSDVSKFGFDLSGVTALSEAEKDLLSFEFSSAHEMEALQGTVQELMDEGIIDEEQLYWEDGVHFKIEEEKVEDGKVEFSVEKWRSGLGAVGYENTASKDANGQWVFGEISEMWIS